MRANILGRGAVILPTQQISEACQRGVRINHWIKHQGGFGDLYVGSTSGVKILIGVGSRQKSSVKVNNIELCCKEQRKGMVS